MIDLNSRFDWCRGGRWRSNVNLSRNEMEGIRQRVFRLVVVSLVSEMLSSDVSPVGKSMNQTHLASQLVDQHLESISISIGGQIDGRSKIRTILC